MGAGALAAGPVFAPGLLLTPGPYAGSSTMPEMVTAWGSSPLVGLGLSGALGLGVWQEPVEPEGVGVGSEVDMGKSSTR